MHNKLTQIIEEKRKEVERLKEKGIPKIEDFFEKRSFKKAISKKERLDLIAEIKFFSPSEGKIRDLSDPVSIGKIYEEEGASAISLITEKKFFKGNIEWLPELKKKVSIPILRKDFIIDPIQIEETKSFGADAILLIARILPENLLKEFISICKQVELDPLVEIHDLEDLKKALRCEAEIIGINNRDLSTFRVDIRKTAELLKYIPEGLLIVSESGISKKEDVEFLKKQRIDAILVGTSIMRSKDIRKKVKEIVASAKR